MSPGRVARSGDRDRARAHEPAEELRRQGRGCLLVVRLQRELLPERPRFAFRSSIASFAPFTIAVPVVPYAPVVPAIEPIVPPELAAVDAAAAASTATVT